MADFVGKGAFSGGQAIEYDFGVAAGGSGASIAVGDVVVVANGYAAKVSDGEGTAGQKLALAISASDETASADGTVRAAFHPSGLIVEGLATTASNLVTGVLFDSVTFDVSGGTIKVDEDDAGAGEVLIWEIDSDSATTGVVRVVLPFALFAS